MKVICWEGLRGYFIKDNGGDIYRKGWRINWESILRKNKGIYIEVSIKVPVYVF